MSGNDIVRKLKAALVERDPGIEKDPVLIGLLADLEDFVVWDRLLRCKHLVLHDLMLTLLLAGTETPKDEAKVPAVAPLEGLTLNHDSSSSTLPQMSVEENAGAHATPSICREVISRRKASPTPRSQTRTTRRTHPALLRLRASCVSSTQPSDHAGWA